MAVVDKDRVKDGFLSLELGVDAGFPSALIRPNQVAWAVNTTFRGGFPTARPGWALRKTDLPEGYFQGAGTYKADDGQSYLAYSVSGHVHLINLSADYAISEITGTGLTNDPIRPHVWFAQAENWLVVQDNLDPPLIYNGASARRAGDHEVPVGGPMVYGKGRLWVARDNLYFGGDLVWSDPSLGRDSVIKFTENEFLAEGGGFAVPDGPITGLIFAANLDTSLGFGDLLVATPTNIYAFDAPIDRETWKNLNYPVQRYAALKFGSFNHESMVNMNGDVTYRSNDGVRSLLYARRDFTEWGNSPISRQIGRALKYDTEPLLYAASGINFANRLHMTIQPQKDNARGVWHRGLLVLDFHLMSGMGQKFPAAWEGVWTGLKILQVVTVDVNRVNRGFVFALSSAGKIQLWEITKDQEFDFDGTDDVPIPWTIETRSMAFGLPSERKRLMGADQWFDWALGPVSLSAFYRADESMCWNPWATWDDCIPYRNCDGTEPCPGYPFTNYVPIHYYQSQQRPRIGLTQPPDMSDQQTGGLTREGYDFQFRYEMRGRYRLKRLVTIAHRSAEDLYGDMRNTTPSASPPGQCATTDCDAIECCDPDDYSYQIGDTHVPSVLPTHLAHPTRMTHWSPSQ
jgi:hypothetical protein